MQDERYKTLTRRILRAEPWADDFFKLLAEYYEAHPTGGSLHIVLDDGNTQNHCLDWCAGYACGCGDDMGNEIAKLMRLMRRSVRRWIVKNYARYRFGRPV